MKQPNEIDAQAPWGHEVPRPIHWWNFWICSSESALYITGVTIMGPMTLIPFLFVELGIDDSWLALFTLSFILMAVANPLGAALAGGMRWKLRYCLRIGLLQRLPFLAVPLGAMFFFDGPGILLALLVFAWVTSHLAAGLIQPVFQVLCTNGIRERWWARMISLRSLLGAVGGSFAAAFVWWVNAHYDAPTNYVILGWAGVALLFVSLYVLSRLREVPMERELPHGVDQLRRVSRQMREILIDDARIRWIVLGRVFRSFGFLVGTYLTAVFIERCGLRDDDMWIPILLATVSQIFANLAAGWIVDNVGAKFGLVLSSLIISANSALLLRAYSIPAFAVVFSLGMFGGSLLMSAWPTLLLKLAPVEYRPAYSSAIFVAAAPGSALVMIAGMLLVRWTGFEFVFYASGLGGLVAAIIFFWKLPDIRIAPSGPSEMPGAQASGP